MSETGNSAEGSPEGSAGDETFSTTNRPDVESIADEIISWRFALIRHEIFGYLRGIRYALSRADGAVAAKVPSEANLLRARQAIEDGIGWLGVLETILRSGLDAFAAETDAKVVALLHPDHDTPHEQVNLAAIVGELLNLLSTKIAEADLRTVVDVPGTISLGMPRRPLTYMLMQLLLECISRAAPNSQLRCTWQRRSRSNALVIEVKGPRVRDLDGRSLFDLPRRGLTQEVEGNAGLFIARWLARRFKFELRYDQRPAPSGDAEHRIEVFVPAHETPHDGDQVE
jgi:hypothetical protein